MNSKEIHYYLSDFKSEYNFDKIKNAFLESINESKNVISNVTKRFPKDSDDNVLESVFSFISKIFGIMSSSKYIVCIERNDDNFRAILILYSIISQKFMVQDKIDISDCPSMIALCGDSWIVVNPEYPIDVITRKLRYIYLNEIDKCSICLEDINDNTPNIECGHLFHRKCLLQHFLNQENEYSCPLCRNKLDIQIKNDEIISIRPKNNTKILKLQVDI
tara:strand:- start:1083 stop:1739 length:657 start_codon:yes stop_codon:yes gene_type:complete